jgi:hypothetical protein
MPVDLECRCDRLTEGTRQVEELTIRQVRSEQNFQKRVGGGGPMSIQCFPYPAAVS